jgi:hypothetical protein
MPRPPRGRQYNIHPAGLLAWDSSSGPPSRAMRWQMGPSSSLTVAGQRRFRTGFPSTRCAANRYAARRARSTGVGGRTRPFRNRARIMYA